MTNREESAMSVNYKGYRCERNASGQVSLYAPDGEFLEFVDDEEDAWYRIDMIWEAAR
jgi:hypothetical protein